MKTLRRLTFAISILSFSQAFGQSNLLAVGQGISAPSMTSTVNFTNGYTHENPVGTVYQTKIRVSGMYATGDDGSDENDTIGAELGAGNGQFGFALGFMQDDCDNCEDDVAGAVAGTFANVGMGLRFEEDISSLGLLFNPMGTHRVGVMAELNDSGGDNNSVTAFGLGYSYASNQFTFTVDASKLDYENEATNDDRIAVTPGVSINLDPLSLSVSYDMYVNEEDGSEADEEVWWGLGFNGGENWHIAVYGDYVREFAFVGSLFF